MQDDSTSFIEYISIHHHIFFILTLIVTVELTLCIIHIDMGRDDEGDVSSREEEFEFEFDIDL